MAALGARSGYEGAKRRKGAKVHAPVDAQDRAQVGALAAAVHDLTVQHVSLGYVDQGYTGSEPANAAAAYGIRLDVITHTEAKRGFIPLPRRWVVEPSVAWTARFRRLTRGHERLAETLAEVSRTTPQTTTPLQPWSSASLPSPSSTRITRSPRAAAARAAATPAGPPPITTTSVRRCSVS